MEHYCIGFDAGTQSVKVAVYDNNMKCIAKSSNQTTLKYPHPGWVDMDADEYFLLTKLGIKQCVHQLKKLGIDPSLIKAIMGDGIIPELSQKGSGLIFNRGTLENTYFYWGFVRTGGLALRWFKDNICKKSDDDNHYKLLSKEAENKDKKEYKTGSL